MCTSHTILLGTLNSFLYPWMNSRSCWSDLSWCVLLESSCYHQGALQELGCNRCRSSCLFGSTDRWSAKSTRTHASRFIYYSLWYIQRIGSRSEGFSSNIHLSRFGCSWKCFYGILQIKCLWQALYIRIRGNTSVWDCSHLQWIEGSHRPEALFYRKGSKNSSWSIPTLLCSLGELVWSPAWGCRQRGLKLGLQNAQTLYLSLFAHLEAWLGRHPACWNFCLHASQTLLHQNFHP